jgi:hypothetical protein
LPCEIQDPLAWSTASIPRLENVSEFRECEADAECALHNANSLECSFCINPIARGRAPRFWQDANSFVVANRIRTDACHSRQFTSMKDSIGGLHHEQYQPLNAFQCQAVSWRSMSQLAFPLRTLLGMIDE